MGIGECESGDPECHKDVQLLQAHLDLMEQAPLENAYKKRMGKGRATEPPPPGYSLHAWTKCDTQDGASVPTGQKTEGHTAASCAEICRGLPDCTGFQLGAKADNEWSREGH